MQILNEIGANQTSPICQYSLQVHVLSYHIFSHFKVYVISNTIRYDNSLLSFTQHGINEILMIDTVKE